MEGKKYIDLRIVLEIFFLFFTALIKLYLKELKSSV